MNRMFASQMSIRTKILTLFLGLFIISFGLVGYIAFTTIEDIGGSAVENNASLGGSAITDSAEALESLGAEIIEHIARDVANDCGDFIKSHPHMTIADLQADSILRDLAIRPVGATGYTALYEQQTSIMRFHPNPKLIDSPMSELKEKLPSFWKTFAPSLDGSIVGGYYDWEEFDGSIRKKFMYMVPVKGTQYMVAATTYIDEFSKPVEETKKKIAAVTRATDERIHQRLQRMEKIFIGIFIMILLAVFGITFFLARLITNPIVALKNGAAAIGGGDLDHRVAVKTGDELQDLARSLNKMAADLKEYMEELRVTTAEKERMTKELEIGKGIQQSFLPESNPEIPGIDIAAFNIPALEVGGDFYDFIPITEDRWGLVIADVSGKGVPAALFMVISRTLIRAHTTSNRTAVEAVTEANRMICEGSKSCMFVTLFYAILDSKKKTLTYVNAGHNPPLMFRGGSVDIALLKAKGIALGVIEEVELEEVEIELTDDDIVVLYTDGVTEAINEKEEAFGEKRLINVIQENRGLPVGDIIDRIRDEVIAFAGDQPQFDDITLMALRAKYYNYSGFPKSQMPRILHP